MAKCVLALIAVTLCQITGAQICPKNLDKFEDQVAALSRSRTCEKTDSWDACSVALGLAGPGAGIAAIALKNAGGTIRDPKFRPCQIGLRKSDMNLFELLVGEALPSAWACLSEKSRQLETLKKMQTELNSAVEKQTQMVRDFDDSNRNFASDIKKIGRARDEVLEAIDKKDIAKVKGLQEKASNLESGVRLKYKGVKEFNEMLDAYEDSRLNVSKWSHEIGELDNQIRKLAFKEMSPKEYLEFLTKTTPGSDAAVAAIKAEIRMATRQVGKALIEISRPQAVLIRSATSRVVIGAGGTLMAAVGSGAAFAGPTNDCVDNTGASPLLFDAESCRGKTELDDSFNPILDMPKTELAQVIVTGERDNGICGFLEENYKKRYGYKTQCGKKSLKIEDSGETYDVTLNGQNGVEKIKRTEITGSTSTAVFSGGELKHILRQNGTKFYKSQTPFYQAFNKIKVATLESISCCVGGSFRPSDEECGKHIASFGEKNIREEILPEGGRH